MCQLHLSYDGFIHTRGVMNDGYLTIREVAVLFKVTKRTILNWQRQRLIPYYKIGRTVRFNPVEIERYLQENCRVGRWKDSMR